ncbi:MAG: hypothetical protein PHH54_03735 [Candidatus Nanoarchaeia archaeon]|nr:hypothetical protein [Candidatus Nanoarchaeia archaeon]MDD5741070.1 hypothetical protein [Candidatus Nanoarchaeia archaeon]
MKSWLKGGLIGAGIGLILFAIDFIKCMTYPANTGPLGYCQVLNHFVVSFNILFNGTLTNVILDYYTPFISLIITILIYLLIGILIGFIIGKFKKKKRK